jgi:DNA polymerase
MDSKEKYNLLQQLVDEWGDCERCGLCEGRNSIVFGEGDPDAKVLIVGEAPGEEEDADGNPFVGRSGELVDKFLRSFGSSRDDVFLTNAVGCRPTKEGKNRPPSVKEVEACKERLHRTIEIVDPLVILILGSTAAKALVKGVRSITSIANDPTVPRLTALSKGQCIDVRRTAFATFHPSYLLRHSEEVEGSPMHRAFEAWGKAFSVADTYEEIYWGKELPDRG